MKQDKKRLSLALVLIVLVASGVPARSEQEEERDTAASAAAKQLSSRDPLLRQQGAEELARTRATAQRKLLEGYRLQEKNARVRLALDWALYRVGKTETLFQLIRALDSPRSEQASAYLSELDAPAPLYYFLEHMNGNTQVKLLQVLAKIGDAETLDKLKPYAESFDPLIAEAARQATGEIQSRLGQTPSDAPSNTSSRPRKVGGGETSP